MATQADGVELFNSILFQFCQFGPVVSHIVNFTVKNIRAVLTNIPIQGVIKILLGGSDHLFPLVFQIVAGRTYIYLVSKCVSDGEDNQEVNPMFLCGDWSTRRDIIMALTRV